MSCSWDKRNEQSETVEAGEMSNPSDDIPSNMTIYINNLNEKIKIDAPFFNTQVLKVMKCETVNVLAPEGDMLMRMDPKLVGNVKWRKVIVKANMVVHVIEGMALVWESMWNFYELKKSLHAVFSQFGKILEVLAFKTLKHRGQAWVVFEDKSSASEALKRMQGFPFYDKPMRIQYAKTKSDIIAKADGTFIPRERRKRHDERAERKRREQQHDINQVGVGINPAYAAYGATPPLSQLHYPGGSKSMLPEAPAPPNNILFVQNLPHETTPMMLQMLFCQYPGFKEVRMVEAKPGIAFVEYGDEMQATVSMQSLQGFKITPQYPMLITYAKK